MSNPLISICVPAYKKPEFVVRLLDAVLRQSYKQVEVILSDDSPDDAVKIAIEPYKTELRIQYYQNTPALGSPKNWNRAIEKATGDYFMLLHQDDWFNDEHALAKYVAAFEKNPLAGFVFCKNTAISEQGNSMVLQYIPSLLPELNKRPLHLLLANVIGPPSNTMLKAAVKKEVQYEERFIWLVDVDYYVHVLQKGYTCVYLDEHLVSIGLHEDQTTVFCRENDEIILKENILFAQKIGTTAFRDLKIYDYYWRLLRNHEVRTEAVMVNSGVEPVEILPVLRHMLKWQQKVPLRLLRMGVVSKTFMFLNYLVSPTA